ncbi:MAG: ribosomal protein [Alphaproteobacteria bacterium]|nr:ribosomal protein [Alphaproteobacteria bacterium]
MHMEVVLLERVPKLGQMGDVVRVKPGFARNYLLPRKKALRATKANMAFFETQRKRLETTNLERKSEAEKVAEKMKDFSVTLLRQASEALQLYGSVGARDIAQAATEAGVQITRPQVNLDKAIKTLGLHDVEIMLHPEVSVHIKVNIARSATEAEFQAQGGVLIADAVRAQQEAEEQQRLAEQQAALLEKPKRLLPAQSLQQSPASAGLFLCRNRRGLPASHPQARFLKSLPEEALAAGGDRCCWLKSWARFCRWARSSLSIPGAWAIASKAAARASISSFASTTSVPRAGC